jgi:2-dehydro-3-deoxyphosphogluconate aldolase/(4S)-4-hydroxy-2-oxoglutarate aldolase
VNRSEIKQAVIECGVVAIIRVKKPGPLVEVAQALYDGGIAVMEFTLNSPGAIEAIAKTREVLPEVIVGAGTVLTADQCREACEAGAEIIVSPGTVRSVIEVAHEYDRVAIPGAFTPTEIMTAAEWGGDIIKLFPAKSAGVEFVKEIMAPLNDVQLLPTGGVTPENVGKFFKAGVCAVGVGGSLVSEISVQDEDFEEITYRARRLKEAVDTAKGKDGHVTV